MRKCVVSAGREMISIVFCFFSSFFIPKTNIVSCWKNAARVTWAFVPMIWVFVFVIVLLHLYFSCALYKHPWYSYVFFIPKKQSTESSFCFKGPCRDIAFLRQLITRHERRVKQHCSAALFKADMLDTRRRIII